MKAQEIYRLASALIFERVSADEDFEHFFLPFLNILLPECLDTENSIRLYKGQEPLEEAPFVMDMDEDVPFASVICRTALPYGIVSHYYQDDMDNYKADTYRARYVAALGDASKCVPVAIADMYGRAE